MNDTLNTIMNRKSVRKFSDTPISEETVKTLLQAGMSGPSCVNSRCWSFVVVRDKEMLLKMADANVKYADPLRGAALGILVCGDLSRTEFFAASREFWVIDGAIAAQNMILAAESLGIGSCWLGTWPVKERVDNQTALFGLPEHIVPHSVIAFGYPAEDVPPGPRPGRPEWDEDRVHWENW
ncbi:MAG: nitroreductase family protein [Clostridia bacterium]|nr:nitroreductase family protein [Clostridia bacterium]